MEEIWRPIKGYEEEYQVSSLGNVRRVGKKITGADGSTVQLPYSTLRQGASEDGVYVCFDSKVSYIHRLVAQAFLEEPNTKCYVAHKDGNKANNSVDNLEWLPYAGNRWHSDPLNPAKGKTVECVETGKTYVSITQACKELGVSYQVFMTIVDKNRMLDGYTYKVHRRG